MAIVNGANYDHSDIQSVVGGDTVRHMYQDTAGRAMLAPTEASSTASMAHVPGTDSEYFVYNNKIYQATSPIAQGGTIVTSGSGANCKEAPVGASLSELKSALKDVENDIGYEIIDLENNKTIVTANGTNITPEHMTTELNWCSCCVSCSAGDVFTITGYGGSSTRLWAFSDLSGNVVGDQAPAQDSKTNYKVTAPTNAAYFAYNSRMGSTHYVYKGVKFQSTLEEINEQLDTNGAILDAIAGIGYNHIDETSPELTQYPQEGYINNDTGAFNALQNYYCYYFSAPFTGELWMDESTGWNQIAIYDGTMFNTQDLVSIGASIRSTIPTENNKMPVTAGNIVVLCREKGVSFSLHYPYGYCISSQQLQYISNALGITGLTEGIILKKIDANQFKIIVPNEDGNHTVEHDFVHITKVWDSLTYVDGDGQTQTATNVKSADYWNCDWDKNAETGQYIAQGNTNFVLKVYGATYHSGSGHGNEVINNFYILADGVAIDFDSMENNATVKCQSLRIIERCNVYSVGGGGSANDYTTNYPALDTSGNPIINFVHTMDIEYKIGNHIITNNSLLVMQNGIKFAQCHGAMLQCYYASANKVMCNNAEHTINSMNGTAFTPETGCSVNLKTNSTQKCNIVEMWGTNYFVRQEMYQDDVSRQNKSRVVFNDYTDRLKAYFQPVIADFGILSGETIEEFNTGDSISVTDVRIIEVK